MDEISQATQSVVRAFNQAMNKHDLDAVMSLMTQDCIFENTQAVPDGTRYEGAIAVRAFWEEFLRETPNARFDEEELIACGDRSIVLWSYDWGNGHVRGVDVMRVREGKVCEKFSYVKG